MSDYFQDQWAGEFGEKYTKRCDVDYSTRQSIFKKIFLELDSQIDVLEIGCNKGHNIRALSCLDAISSVTGIEINRSAIKIAIQDFSWFADKIINGSIYDIPMIDRQIDMVFTSGVLIHIPSDKLSLAMSEMHRVSNKYIMMIEYPSDKESGKKYRDFEDKEGVWSRPYGDIFQKQFPECRLKLSGKIKDLGNDGWGFTDCDYWVFEKGK